jgi:hypothetical protein
MLRAAAALRSAARVTRTGSGRIAQVHLSSLREVSVVDTTNASGTSNNSRESFSHRCNGGRRCNGA